VANIVQPFAPSPGSPARRIGLVNCFYQLANPTTVAMCCEAVAVNADFWSQVLQGVSFRKLDFALGAVMALQRKCLAEIGGFRALADCLADDYQLGHRIAQRGYAIELSPVVVQCWSAPMHRRQVWRHQLRWARTIRVCQPLPYFFSILANATFWPLVWALADLSKWTVNTQSPSDNSTIMSLSLPISAFAFVIFIVVRMQMAWDLQRRLARSHRAHQRFLARADQGSGAGRPLAVRIRRQPHRMARGTLCVTVAMARSLKNNPLHFRISLFVPCPSLLAVHLCPM